MPCFRIRSGNGLLKPDYRNRLMVNPFDARSGELDQFAVCLLQQLSSASVEFQEREYKSLVANLNEIMVLGSTFALKDGKPKRAKVAHLDQLRSTEATEPGQWSDSTLSGRPATATG